MNNRDFTEEVIDIGAKGNFDKYKKNVKNYTTLGIMVVLLIILSLNSVYKVDDGTVGVVIRLGKVSKVERSAGIHFKIPLIDSVRSVNTSRVSIMEYGYQTVRRGTETSEPVYAENFDEATIIVDAVNNNASIALIYLMVQYRVVDPVNYLFKVDDIEGTLRLALEDSIRTTVQELTLDEAKKEKPLIDTRVKEVLQQKMYQYESGIDIISVQTQDVEFPSNVEIAYQEKENANQYKNSKLEEAEKYSNTVMPRAHSQATQMMEEAKAYERQVIAQANADVAQFNALYNEYIVNPEIIQERYYIEAMRAFIENNNVIIDNTVDDSIYKFFNFNNNALRQSVID
ncbi:protease FtsH subunit HflK [Natranaerovirga pectinivora]|uniref:Protein HflK n=1 Tax=Natranaerovirga pectinivora TaxID=682400 RepID=A0A4R3MMX6_9FIRM|nr:FtsH protease activity modulator HflK [Natranaerovirga pectinivora]TCT16339.1 protease FtsH subunit HflK [Natranaerovirga pectinivora]